MKKIVYFVVGLFLLSSFAAIGIHAEASEQQQISINFNTPNIKQSNVESYLKIEMEGANGYIYHEGEPVLPVYKENLEFPFGTKIKQVTCTPKDEQSMQISDQILPAPKPQIVNSISKDIKYDVKTTVYENDEYYPDNWYYITKGAGLNKNQERKTFVTLQTCPVKYNPVENKITYTSGFDIEITYETPNSPILPTNSEYDMVIITPSKLYDNTLQNLMDHKNSKGMSTYIKTTNDIYSQYTGNDHAEQIKYFIKDAIETYGIKYVLLVGGLDSYIWGVPRDSLSIGDKDWHLPVRYNNMRYESGKTADPGFITDLYFADIYDSEGGFETWDTNDDGVYAQWTRFSSGKDILDVYPDVYVGRLACRNVFEVKIMTNKIMEYENNAYGSDWANKMIVIGGDSHDDEPNGFDEGEVMGDKILNDYMTEFTPVKIYASYQNSNPSMTPTPDNIIREISKGSGHLFLDGHANPGSWNTHWPGEHTWTGGIQVSHFPQLSNKNMYPICNVEGCHNSQFNVSLIGTLLDGDNEKKTWCYGSPVPECWSWWLARKINGGSLATIGNTGLGYGAVGNYGDLDGDGIDEPDTVEALGGYFFSMIYKNIDEGAEYLGDVWGGAIHDYLSVYPPMDDQLDTKEMEQLCLLGDPSLKLGGYATSSNQLRINGADDANPNELLEQKASVSGGSGYTYHWDLDEDGAYDDYTGDEVELQFEKPGYYSVGVKATGSSGQITYEKVIQIKKDETPSTPDINAPSSAKLGAAQTFTFSSNDPYNDEIVYLIDWGDDTNSIIGPLESGETATAKHSWNIKNSYTVKIKAFDSFTGESQWAEHTINVAKVKNINQPAIIQFLQNILEKYPNAFPMLKQIFGL